jgi:hypothetical protein
MPMARQTVPVYTPTTAGSTVSPQTLDATNFHAVPSYDPKMRIVVENTGGASLNVTIKAIACPTCGVTTDKVIAVAAGTKVQFGNFRNDLFKQADGSLYVNPSAATGTIYAISQPL